jgi:hypothetical protein
LVNGLTVSVLDGRLKWSIDKIIGRREKPSQIPLCPPEIPYG